MESTCALCLQQRELQLSHIIPSFVIDWLKTSQFGAIRAGQAPNRRTQDAYKIPLLCSACEQQFSKWETPFSKKIFAPYHQNGSASLTYGPWALRCLLSISWRVVHYIKSQSGIKHFNQTQVQELDKALERWHFFLSGEEVSVGPYTQQLLPLGILEKHTVPNLSPFLNRYLVGSLDLDVVCSERVAYSFAKLGQLVLFGRITDQNPEDWAGTEVNADSGKIEPRKFSIPAGVLQFLNDRANHAGYLLSTMSKKQKTLASAALIKDADDFARTDLAQAMAADIAFSGNKAFEITGDGKPSGDGAP